MRQFHLCAIRASFLAAAALVCAVGLKAPSEAAGSASSLLVWSDPGVVESRDLLHGSAVPEEGPDAAGTFEYVELPNPGSRQRVVLDARGRAWEVVYGAEARADVSASRILWAVGYHTDRNYFVPGPVMISGRSYRDVRFKWRAHGEPTHRLWQWRDNPLVGKREFEGLKVLMALLNNWDLKDENNRWATDDDGASWLYVSDLGKTLGKTGPAYDRSKGNPEHFAREPLIKGVANGLVEFHWNGDDHQDVLTGIKTGNARWLSDLLSRLSDRQLEDAFRAGGFSGLETAQYVGALRVRINDLRRLR